MALQVRLCAHLSRKAKLHYILFLFEGNSDFERLLPIHVTNSAGIRLFAPKDGVSLEYDDRVLLRFTPDNPGLIPGLQASGEYIRDRATVNINDSDGKRSLCLGLASSYNYLII